MREPGASVLGTARANRARAPLGLLAHTAMMFTTLALALALSAAPPAPPPQGLMPCDPGASQAHPAWGSQEALVPVHAWRTKARATEQASGQVSEQLTAPASERVTAPARPEDPSADTKLSRKELAKRYRALVAEYEAAEAAYRQLAETEVVDWSSDPAVIFPPRFAALADAGSSEALEWIVYSNSPKSAVDYADYLERALHSNVDVTVWMSMLHNRYSVDAYGRYIVAALVEMLVRYATGPEAKHSKQAQVLVARLLATGNDADFTKRAMQAYEALIAAPAFAMNRNKLTAELDELRTRMVGHPAPPLAGPDVDGLALDLSELRGKVVLIEFWGFW